MVKKLLKLILIGVIGFMGYAAYDSYKGGYFSIPDLPDRAYPVSFRNGFRAILMDAEVNPRYSGMADDPKYFRRLANANPDRKYLGLPMEVQSWFEDAWSWCKSPTSEEYAELSRMPEELKRMFTNARFEGVCRIEVDGEEIVRGLLFSVPRL